MAASGRKGADQLKTNPMSDPTRAAASKVSIEHRLKQDEGKGSHFMKSEKRKSAAANLEKPMSDPAAVSPQRHSIEHRLKQDEGKGSHFQKSGVGRF
jgi:hypothetical protein